MYEHPMKRAGLVFNRMLYSNTKVALPAFPGANEGKFRLQYKVKFYDNGKETARKIFSSANLDELFPSRK
eukprot:403366948